MRNFPGLLLGNSMPGIGLELAIAPFFLRPFFFFFFEDERGTGATFRDAAAPGIGDRPRRPEGLPLRAVGMVGWFSSMGGASGPKEAGVAETSFADDGFCVGESPLRPEDGRAPEVGDLVGWFSSMGGAHNPNEAIFPNTTCRIAVCRTPVRVQSRLL